MDLHATYIKQLDDTVDGLRKSTTSCRMEMEQFANRNVQIRQRLLQLMLKLELCRGKNLVLQPSERKAVEEVWTISQKVHQLGKAMELLNKDGDNYKRHLMLIQQQRRLLGGNSAEQEQVLDEGLMKEVNSILKIQGDGMNQLNAVLKKDERDLEIVKRGTLDSASVVGRTGAPPGGVVSGLPVKIGGFQ